MYPFGVIGNCQVSALISHLGSIEWSCLPRPDSPPIFGKLLDPEGGEFSIGTPEYSVGQQSYIKNTNILETIFEDETGSFKVVDFAPRFEQFGRMYRPPTIIRIVTPLKGNPRASIRCRVIQGWSKEQVRPIRGSSHLRFPGFSDELRLTTNMSLSHLVDELPITITEPLYFALTWGSAFHDDLTDTCQQFLNKTKLYWRTWVKHCSIPPKYQDEVIRSALALKLHCFEDTGAIIAAMTTSLPETKGEVRNWDYRFCWLRDAYFTVSALYKLGHYEEMEGILKFILNVVRDVDKIHLSPVYKLDGTLPLPELTADHWEGFANSKPVRIGNQAAEHIQNDVYGEALLTLAPLYFDERFSYLRDEKFESLLRTLAARCHSSLTEPDAGLWELRSGWKVHSFTLLMSWAGLERYERLIKENKIQGSLPIASQWRKDAEDALKKFVRNGILWNSDKEDVLDASLLLLASLRFPDKELCNKTIIEIQKTLSMDGADNLFYRYKIKDDFGTPSHAFIICSFWMVEALSKIGKNEDAHKVLEKTLDAQNHVGLFSEHYDPHKGEQTGNFPQCYSHVGLIHAAFAVSPQWDEVL